MTFGDELLDITPKAQSTKEKIKKSDLIKIKIFCSVRDTAKRINRQSTDWKKYLQSISDKRFVSKIGS